MIMQSSRRTQKCGNVCLVKYQLTIFLSEFINREYGLVFLGSKIFIMKMIIFFHKQYVCPGQSHKNND